MVDRPRIDPMGAMFCNALTADGWVVGGAINNGGVVLGWAGDVLAPDLGDEPELALLELATLASPGCDGLIMLPYLLSERAPHWNSIPRCAYIGLTREHHREHLVRAALEGVCQQLALMPASMRTAGIEVYEIRATGGFARSPLWRQLLAHTLGMPIGFPPGHKGSCFDAALLGMDALGLIESIDVAAKLVTIAETVHPNPIAAAIYPSLRPIVSELYDALLPTFTSLADLEGQR